MGTYQEKLSILSEMIGFARVDHSLKRSEYEFLLKVARNLGVPKDTLDGLLKEKSPKVRLKTQAERIVQFHRLILLMNIDHEQHKKEINTMIDTTISEVRSMTNALMPATLEDFGIGPTLKNYVDTIQQSVTLQIDFDDASQGNISNELAINLFRIVQELINNTLKHANASQIKITLSEFDTFISLFYFDDGGGFDMNSIILGSGITNIKERVSIFNGKIDIQTNNGNTIFEIEIPV